MPKKVFFDYPLNESNTPTSNLDLSEVTGMVEHGDGTATGSWYNITRQGTGGAVKAFLVKASKVIENGCWVGVTETRTEVLL